MKFVISSALIIGLLSACLPKPNAKEIEIIDKLLIAIDSASATLQQIDTTGFDELNRNLSIKTNFITSAYTQRKDTMNKETALLIASYRDMRKPLRNSKAIIEETARELQFTREQLENLRTDLEHNLHDSIRVRKFISAEYEAANMIIAKSTNLSTGAKKTKENAALYEPKIDSVIAVLKSQP